MKGNFIQGGGGGQTSLWARGPEGEGEGILFTEISTTDINGCVGYAATATAASIAIRTGHTDMHTHPPVLMKSITSGYSYTYMYNISRQGLVLHL